MPFRKFDDAMLAMGEALSHPGDLDKALDRIVQAAAGTVPGADYASITVRRADGRLITTAATAAIVREADELQYELGEGPCYDAVTVDTVTYSPDLSRDPQWPRFGPKVAEMGLLSQMGLRLINRDGEVTGLNLYSHSRKAFEDPEGLPELFASHARVALGYATQLQTLQGAIGSRETIGKAIGILMERYDLTSERAFEFLIRQSQNSNVKLRDVAADVIIARRRADNAQTASFLMGQQTAARH
jgi:ANTAR domain-containing protein/GAF domain-containing protein